jgi:hypothetical protein
MNAQVADSIIWSLYELARTPTYQSRMRKEINEVYATSRAKGEAEIAFGDLEKMEFTNAFIKVGLIAMLTKTSLSK